MEEIDEDLYKIEEVKMKVSIKVLSSFFGIAFVLFAPFYRLLHFLINVLLFFQVAMDVPVTLDFTILQLAKLRMLQFYYNHLDR